MPRALRALIVPLACLVGTFTLAPASYADRMAHRDARHDVMRIVGGGSLDDLVAAPRVRDPDVIRTVVAHRRHNVVLRLKFADLQRRGAKLQLATIRTDTKTDGVYGLTLISGPGMVMVFLDNTEGPARCYGLGYRISYHRNLVQLSVPRSCLGNPRWIRAGQGVIGLVGKGNVYVDDGLQDGISNNLRLTRKLYRA
jgi:hypothetical protein